MSAGNGFYDKGFRGNELPADGTDGFLVGDARLC